MRRCHNIPVDPRIPNSTHHATQDPRCSRFLSTAFQINQPGLNSNSSRWLMMARIRIVNYVENPSIVNYVDCQDSALSIVLLRNWRGLSAHWKESLSRSLSSEVSLSAGSTEEGLEKPGRLANTFLIGPTRCSPLPLFWPRYPISSLNTRNQQFPGIWLLSN